MAPAANRLQKHAQNKNTAQWFLSQHQLNLYAQHTTGGLQAAVALHSPGPLQESLQLTVQSTLVQVKSAYFKCNCVLLFISCCCSLAVQTAIQPWTATATHYILQHGVQPNLEFVRLPDSLFEPCDAAAAAAATAGTVSYQHVRGRYGVDMVPLGFYSSSRQQLLLNPSEGSRLEPGDILVALARATGALHSQAATQTAADVHSRCYGLLCFMPWQYPH